jgi:predicted small secreted protein
MEILRGARQSFASALVAIFVLAGAAAVLSACNTARGFGQDMSDAGQAVSNTAQRIGNGE